MGRPSFVSSLADFTNAARNRRGGMGMAGD